MERWRKKGEQKLGRASGLSSFWAPSEAGYFVVRTTKASYGT